MTMFLKQVCGKRQEEKERLKTKKKRKEYGQRSRRPSFTPRHYPEKEAEEWSAGELKETEGVEKIVRGKSSERRLGRSALYRSCHCMQRGGGDKRRDSPYLL